LYWLVAEAAALSMPPGQQQQQAAAAARKLSTLIKQDSVAQLLQRLPAATFTAQQKALLQQCSSALVLVKQCLPDGNMDYNAAGQVSACSSAEQHFCGLCCPASSLQPACRTAESPMQCLC
jgi:hypothetical protein